MGGAVSSGRNNNELIDNLKSGNYIRTKQVELVFRALDRADYMTPEARDQAYKDLAWRNGPLHISSPCIYSEVMEGLELKPGLSFLNVGSGTGYLSSLVGLILGTAGISHGIEVQPGAVEYATNKNKQFIENSPTLDDFDFCEPKYYNGNGLCMTPLQCGYDRVYCGADCPTELEMYFKQLIKVGGLLVIPVNDTLMQVRRVASATWVSRSLLNVSFSAMRLPTKEEKEKPVKLDSLRPVRLQLLSRAVVRSCMRAGVLRRNPELQHGSQFEPPPACPRRICIPIEPGGSVEGLNVLHDLSSESGANEMNALLSLVISMGQNRVAGALRIDRVDPGSDDEDGTGAPEGDRGVGGVDDQSEDRPKGVDPLVSDSGGKSDANVDSGRSADAGPTPLPGGSERRSGQSRGPGPRRRPRPPGDSSDDKSPPGNAMREFLRMRRDAKPSTSTAESAILNALTYTEAMANKESVVENSEKMDNATGPPRCELLGVPSVVEIDLREASDMECDPALDAAARRLADPDPDEAPKSGPKRQKMDGAIEENTPGGSGGGEADLERPRDGPAAGGSGVVVARSMSPGPELRAHMARQKRRQARGGSARRVRLSLLMKQAVRELPLPHALKKFVNLGRCFEF